MFNNFYCCLQNAIWNHGFNYRCTNGLNVYLILSSFWLDWWAHLGMREMRSMQNWHKLKLILFMKVSRKRKATMKKSLGFLPQGVRLNLSQLSTVIEMSMESPLVRYKINNFFHLRITCQHSWDISCLYRHLCMPKVFYKTFFFNLGNDENYY